MKRDYFTRLLLLLPVPFILYVVPYFVLVRVDKASTAVAGGRWFALPYYRFVRPSLDGQVRASFAPIHYADRAYLRPGKWSGSIWK